MSNFEESDIRYSFEYNAQMLNHLLDNSVSIDERNAIIKDIKLPSAEEVIQDIFMTLNLVDDPNIPIDESTYVEIARQTSKVWVGLTSMKSYFDEYGTLKIN